MSLKRFLAEGLEPVLLTSLGHDEHELEQLLEHSVLLTDCEQCSGDGEENVPIGAATTWSPTKASNDALCSSSSSPPRVPLRPPTQIPLNCYEAFKQKIRAGGGPQTEVLNWTVSLDGSSERDRGSPQATSLRLIAGPKRHLADRETYSLVCLWHAHTMLISEVFGGSIHRYYWTLRRPAVETVHQAEHASCKTSTARSDTEGQLISTAYLEARSSTLLEQATGSHGPGMTYPEHAYVFRSLDAPLDTTGRSMAPATVACFVPAGSFPMQMDCPRKALPSESRTEHAVEDAMISGKQLGLWVAYSDGLLACYLVPHRGANEEPQQTSSSLAAPLGALEPVLCGLLHNSRHSVINQTESPWVVPKQMHHSVADEGLLGILGTDGSVIVLDTWALLATADAPRGLREASSLAHAFCSAPVPQWSLPRHVRSSLQGLWIAGRSANLWPTEESNEAQPLFLITFGTNPAMGLWRCRRPSRAALMSASAQGLAQQWQHRTQRWFATWPKVLKRAAQSLPDPAATMTRRRSRPQDAVAVDASRMLTKTRATEHHEQLYSDGVTEKQHGVSFEAAERFAATQAPTGATSNPVLGGGSVSVEQRLPLGQHPSTLFFRWHFQTGSVHLQSCFDDPPRQIVQSAMWRHPGWVHGSCWLLAVDRAGHVLLFNANAGQLMPLYMHKAVGDVQVSWLDHPYGQEQYDPRAVSSGARNAIRAPPPFLLLDVRQGVLSLYVIGDDVCGGGNDSALRPRPGWIHCAATWAVPYNSCLLEDGAIQTPTGDVFVWHQARSLPISSTGKTVVTSSPEGEISSSNKILVTPSPEGETFSLENILVTPSLGDSEQIGKSARTSCVTTWYAGKTRTTDACTESAPTSPKQTTAAASTASTSMGAVTDPPRESIREQLLPLIEYQFRRTQEQQQQGHRAPSETKQPMDSSNVSVSIPEYAHLHSRSPPSIEEVLYGIKEHPKWMSCSESGQEQRRQPEQSAALSLLGHWIGTVSAVLGELLSASDWVSLPPGRSLALTIASLTTLTISNAWQHWQQLCRDTGVVSWHQSWTIFWRKLEYVQAVANWYQGVLQSHRGDASASSKEVAKPLAVTDNPPTLHQVLACFELRWRPVGKEHPCYFIALTLRREGLHGEQEEARWVEQALEQSLFPADSSGKDAFVCSDHLRHWNLLSIGLEPLDCVLLLIRSFFTQARWGKQPQELCWNIDEPWLAGMATTSREEFIQSMTMKILPGRARTQWIETLHQIWDVFESEARDTDDTVDVMDEVFADAVLHNPPILHAAALSFLYREQRAARQFTSSTRPGEASDDRQGNLNTLWAATDWALTTWRGVASVFQSHLPDSMELLCDWNIFRWNTTFQGPLPRIDHSDTQKNAGQQTLPLIEASTRSCGRQSVTRRLTVTSAGQATTPYGTSHDTQRIWGISLRIVIAHHLEAVPMLLHEAGLVRTGAVIMDEDLNELVALARDELARALSLHPERRTRVRHVLSPEAFQWVQLASMGASEAVRYRKHWRVWGSILETLTLLAADQTSELVVRLVQLAAAFRALVPQD